jgi:hypothetical protein
MAAPGGITLDPMVHDPLSYFLRDDPASFSAWAQTSRDARAAFGDGQTRLAAYCTDFATAQLTAASQKATMQCLKNMEKTVVAYRWTANAVTVPDVAVRFSFYPAGARGKVSTPWVARSGLVPRRPSSSPVVTMAEMSQLIFDERTNLSFSCDVYLYFDIFKYGGHVQDIRVGGPRILAGADVSKAVGTKMWGYSGSLKVTFKTQVPEVETYW